MSMFEPLGFLRCTLPINGRIHTVFLPVLEIERVEPARPQAADHLWLPWPVSLEKCLWWVWWRDVPPQALPVHSAHEVQWIPLTQVCPVPILLQGWAQRHSVVGFVQEGDRWVPLLSRYIARRLWSSRPQNTMIPETREAS